MPLEFASPEVFSWHLVVLDLMQYEGEFATPKGVAPTHLLQRDIRTFHDYAHAIFTGAQPVIFIVEISVPS